MTASLHVLPSSQLHDMPDMLRQLADAIESGKYGCVPEAAVVLGTDQIDRIEVFGFGRADGVVTHYLLGCGMAKLQRPRLGDE